MELGLIGCTFSPAIRSATMTPSWLALWANHGAPATSPIANRPSTPVRQYSSVTTWVRSMVTPSASSPKSSTLPTMPTAEITVSKSSVVVLPSCSIWAVTLPLPRSSFLTIAFSRIFIPCFSNCFFANFEISSSSTGRTRSITSTTVVSAPKVL